MDRPRHLKYFLLLTIGYILSPLSWWNDLVVNVPLAYVIAWPLAQWDEQFFLPAMIVAYWFTNLLGFLLLHWGGQGLIVSQRPSLKLKQSLLVSVLYSVLVIIFVVLGWLEPPTVYFEQLTSR
jgi:hypothetical protein